MTDTTLFTPNYTDWPNSDAFSLKEISITTGNTGATGPTGPTGPAVSESVSASVSAAGTNVGTATQLTSNINVLGTVGSGTGVILVAAATVGVGNSVTIYNNGAHPCAVYAGGSDQIDGISGSTGVVLTNGSRCMYTVTAAHTFVSALLGATSA